MPRPLHLVPALGLLVGLGRPTYALSPASHDALQIGDCGPALADLRGADADDPVLRAAEHLAIARCALRAGDPGRALVSARGARGGPLDGYARLVEGELQLDRGDPAGALAALQGLELPGPAGRRARQLLGRAYVEAGKYEEARVTLNAVLEGRLSARAEPAEPGGADPAELRWWLAQGALGRGERDKAIPVLEKLWAWHPTSPWADKAASELTRLGAPPGGAGSPAARELLKERARALEKLSLYAEALALRDQLGWGSDPASLRALAGDAFQARDYARAAATYAKIPDPTPEERLQRALATSRAGDYPAAAALYKALLEAAPGTPQADTASYKIGYLSVDKGDFAAAVPLLQAHLQRLPQSAHADEARWYIGWARYKAGDLAGARAAFQDLLRLHPRSSLAAGARYWSARIDGRQGDAAAEKAGYEAVLQSWPQSGHAWFAAWRLDRRPPAPAPFTRPPDPPALAGPAWQRGRALAEVGLDAWARQELGPLARQAASAGPQARLALAHALIDAGDYTQAQRLAAELCGKPWKGTGDPAANAACWPRPAGDVLLRRARAGGLDPNLPFGIMMAESSLQPEVTSPAGARGLMQLMPEVAAGLAGQVLPGQPFHPDQLYVPGTNAALGTAELLRLHQRFEGRLDGPHLPAVIAGYNAGPDAVERWLAKSPTPMEPDEFAEDIGYTETRRYVKRVLGYVQVWRQVYGDG